MNHIYSPTKIIHGKNWNLQINNLTLVVFFHKISQSSYNIMENIKYRLSFSIHLFQLKTRLSGMIPRLLNVIFLWYCKYEFFLPFCIRNHWLLKEKSSKISVAIIGRSVWYCFCSHYNLNLETLKCRYLQISSGGIHFFGICVEQQIGKHTEERKMKDFIQSAWKRTKRIFECST